MVLSEIQIGLLEKCTDPQLAPTLPITIELDTNKYSLLYPIFHLLHTLRIYRNFPPGAFSVFNIAISFNFMLDFISNPPQNLTELYL